ncbi:MAG TPA: high-potential iron-sulfur protein [Steroidobacteraceae bacterium]|nr:high-potential iron-sulfur protein [Steroidobacteraceae bacterium]
MNENRFNRRTVIKGALAGLAALPAAGLVRDATAQDLVKIEESDPQAKALGYVHDASTVDASKNPMFKPGANCANCLQIAGKEGEEWRPCNIFPGKLVHSDGWCKVWVAKP